MFFTKSYLLWHCWFIFNFNFLSQLKCTLACHFIDQTMVGCWTYKDGKHIENETFIGEAHSYNNFKEWGYKMFISSHVWEYNLEPLIFPKFEHWYVVVICLVQPCLTCNWCRWLLESSAGEMLNIVVYHVCRHAVSHDLL
jgi:hypothetical protein